jgi:hypothetical protein
VSGVIVRTIPSQNGRYRGDVICLPDGSFRVDVLRFTEEWVEGYGKVAEFWERVNRGVTFTDTLERAESLVRDELALLEPAPRGSV